MGRRAEGISIQGYEKLIYWITFTATCACFFIGAYAFLNITLPSYLDKQKGECMLSDAQIEQGVSKDLECDTSDGCTNEDSIEFTSSAKFTWVSPWGEDGVESSKNCTRRLFRTFGRKSKATKWLSEDDNGSARECYRSKSQPCGLSYDRNFSAEGAFLTYTLLSIAVVGGVMNTVLSWYIRYPFKSVWICLYVPCIAGIIYVLITSIAWCWSKLKACCCADCVCCGGDKAEGSRV